MQNSRKQSLIVLAALVLAGGFVYLQMGGVQDRRNAVVPLVRQFEEKTETVDGIIVQAQPELLADGNLQFLLQLTTHSGDLSPYDAERNLRLKSGGEELVPLRAENAAGSGPSEHHRELTAVFTGPSSDVFALVFRELGDAGEVTLQWP